MSHKLKISQVKPKTFFRHRKIGAQSSGFHWPNLKILFPTLIVVALVFGLALAKSITLSGLPGAALQGSTTVGAGGGLSGSGWDLGGMADTAGNYAVGGGMSGDGWSISGLVTNITGGGGGGGGGTVFSGGEGGLVAPEPLNGVATTGSLLELLLGWANFTLPYLVVLAVLSLIYGGFLFVTAGGNPDGIKKGTHIIMWSAIGIVLVLSSYAIVNTLVNFDSGL